MLIKLKADFMNQKAGQIVEAKDEEAEVLISKGIAEKASEDALSAIVTKASDALMTKVNDSVSKIIDATLRQFLEAQSQAKKFAMPAIFGKAGDGDPKKNFGDWLHHAVIACTAHGKKAIEAIDHLDKNYDQLNIQKKTALGESSGQTGGYTVPQQFSEQIQLLMAENTFIRPRAFVQPMTSAVLQIPYLDVTTPQAAGTSPFFGGLKVQWTAEAQTRTESEPQFKQLELRPWELSAYSVSSNVLLQDSAIGLEKFLYQLFAQCIGWTEEYAFLQGNGVGKPVGMLTCNANLSVNRVTAGKISYADVAGLISHILPSSLQRAIWVVHPYGLIDLVQLRDASGRVVWVNALGGATDKIPGYLMGRPVFVSEKVPS